MRANAQPIADVLVKEVAKPAADSYTGGQAPGGTSPLYLVGWVALGVSGKDCNL